MTPYHDQQQGSDVPGKPFNLSSEGTIQRVNLLVGSTNLFPRINTLPRPAWATRSRRDNLSMRWCRQSQHARALFTWAKGVNFSSHINARLGSMTRLGGWPFYPGRVFSIQTGPQGPPGVCLRISARRRGRMTIGIDTMFPRGTYWVTPSSDVVYIFHMCRIWHKGVWTIDIFLISIKFGDVWTWFEGFF